MAETVTYAVELAVGLGCLGAAVPVLRRPARRWLGVVLAAAGALAIGHAVIELAAG